MGDARAPVDVAVGVVVRGDGAVLLGQRVAGKPYAGWWEFPGGKLEAVESVEHALARELHEELGLDVRASVPWVVREFSYPHARVRLHFRRVFDFAGEPQSREGQAFVWRAPQAIDVAPLLPATVPVLAWLQLAPECVRSDAARAGEAAFAAAVDAALAAGTLGMLWLREPALPASRFERLFAALHASLRAAGVPLLVDSAHPRACAEQAGGLVLAASHLRAAPARPALRRVGACCETAADLERAAALGLDFAVLRDPVAAAAAERAALPWYLDRDAADDAGAASGTVDLDAARRAGAHGLVTRLASAPGAAAG